MNDQGDWFEVNCGGCGKKLLLQLSELGSRFTLDRGECERKIAARRSFSPVHCLSLRQCPVLIDMPSLDKE